MSSLPFVHKIPDPPVPTAYKLESPRGAKLATRVWAPPSSTSTPSTASPPRALLLLIHGYGWHSGYFDELAHRLNQQNIFCASYDQACHGYSEPEPHAPKGYVHVASFDDWVEDLFAAAVWARQECGYSESIVPLFLLGESLGGLQVLEAALQSKFYGVRISGVITLGAVLQVNPSLLPPKPVLKVLSFLAPYYPRLKMPVDGRLDATYDEAFGDQEWAKLTRQDTHVLHAPATTLAGAVAVLDTAPAVASKATEFSCPLLAFHAKFDSRTSAEPMRQFLQQRNGIPESDATGVWINSAGHQLLQDRRDITVSVMEQIAQWIVEHTAPQKT